MIAIMTVLIIAYAIGITTLGFSVAVQPMNLLVTALGTVLGIVFGALPGLSGTMGIAILLPITYGMHPTKALLLMGCVGMDSFVGHARYTFHIAYLQTGIQLIVALIVLFSISQVLILLSDKMLSFTLAYFPPCRVVVLDGRQPACVLLLA